MPPSPVDPDAFKRMVLQSLPAPAWLSADGPEIDVVLSSRARVMRNVRGYRFPNRATDSELAAVEASLVAAARRSGLDFRSYSQLSIAERQYMIGCRLMAPDFDTTLPSRTLLLDSGRVRSVMVNEEDHCRLQALTSGLALGAAEGMAADAVAALGRSVEWAQSPRHGYLAASPFNAGEGRRASVMLHLIGLAHTKRLPEVLHALSSDGITTRGLFGESSRAVGAFVQISQVRGQRAPFEGALDYLLESERARRAELGAGAIGEAASRAREFAVTAKSLGLADSLRVLAWARLASVEGLPDFPSSPRDVDVLLTNLELRASSDESRLAQHRATLLRQALGG